MYATAAVQGGVNLGPSVNIPRTRNSERLGSAGTPRPNRIDAVIWAVTAVLRNSDGETNLFDRDALLQCLVLYFDFDVTAPRWYVR
jgi:hypothetical protein